MTQTHSFRSLRVVLALVVMLALVGVVAAQDSECPLGGYIDDSGDCSFGITVTVAYPDWLSESEAASAAVAALLNATRDQFLSWMMTPVEEFYRGGFLDISYEEYEHGAALRSIVFLTSEYTGGAHPNSYYASVTVDTIADRELTLADDIFQPGVDAIAVLQPLVVAQLVEQQGEYADLEWISDGTDSFEDYTAWAINAGTLELFFAPYQVAAYAAGSFQVSIPVDALTGVINPMLLP